MTKRRLPRRTDPKRPIEAVWVGKYIRLYFDRAKNKFVEGIVEWSRYMGAGRPPEPVLRTHDGVVILSTHRDFEEIAPTPALLEALERALLQRAVHEMRQTCPRTIVCIQNVQDALAKLETPENRDALVVLRLLLKKLVETEADEVGAMVRAQVSPIARAAEALSVKVEHVEAAVRHAATAAYAEDAIDGHQV